MTAKESFLAHRPKIYEPQISWWLRVNIFRINEEKNQARSFHGESPYQSDKLAVSCFIWIPTMQLWSIKSSTSLPKFKYSFAPRQTTVSWLIGILWFPLVQERKPENFLSRLFVPRRHERHPSVKYVRLYLFQGPASVNNLPMQCAVPSRTYSKLNYSAKLPVRTYVLRWTLKTQHRDGISKLLWPNHLVWNFVRCKNAWNLHYLLLEDTARHFCRDVCGTTSLLGEAGDFKFKNSGQETQHSSHKNDPSS